LKKEKVEKLRRRSKRKILSPQVMRKRVTDMITSNTIHLPLARTFEHSKQNKHKAT
jgi:hypothetical protein